MKVTLVLLAGLGVLACCEAPLPHTLMPCPTDCPPTPRFVCASDKEGNIYRFLNYCHFQKCGCRMWLLEVPMSQCPVATPSCPLKASSLEIGDGTRAQDDDDESQSDDFQSAQQSAPADSLEEAHLQHNAVRKNH